MAACVFWHHTAQQIYKLLLFLPFHYFLCHGDAQHFEGTLSAQVWLRHADSYPLTV